MDKEIKRFQREAEKKFKYAVNALEGLKVVNKIYSRLNDGDADMGTLINTILCEYLTEDEVRKILVNQYAKNKQVRSLINQTLEK